MLKKPGQANLDPARSHACRGCPRFRSANAPTTGTASLSWSRTFAVTATTWSNCVAARWCPGMNGSTLNGCYLSERPSSLPAGDPPRSEIHGSEFPTPNSLGSSMRMISSSTRWSHSRQKNWSMTQRRMNAAQPRLRQPEAQPLTAVASGALATGKEDSHRRGRPLARTLTGAWAAT